MVCCSNKIRMKIAGFKYAKIKVNKFFILGVFLFAFFGFAKAANAATYFISPSGSDSNSGTSTTDPWKTFTFAIPKLQPGDTLILKDGVYTRTTTGFPNIDCAASAKNGTAAQPITIKAENQRKAFLQSDAVQLPFYMNKCAYWIIDGLRAESQDNPNATSGYGGVFYIYYSDHIIMRNSIGAHNNRFTNSAVFGFYYSTNSTIEDSEAYYFHRHGFSIFGSLNITARRAYANSRGYKDLQAGDQMYPSGIRQHY